MPIIICEILWAQNEEKLKDNKNRNERISKFLNEINYSLFQNIKSEDNNTIKSLKRVIELENQVYTLENRELCDYLMVHIEDEKLIQKQFK